MLRNPLTRTRLPLPDTYQQYLSERELLVELEGPRLRLRFVRLADATRLCALFQDPEVARYFTWIPPSDLEETQEYILGFQQEIYRQAAYHFTILDRTTDEPMGVCNLYHINRGQAEAEVGIWLGRPFWGRRYQAEVNHLLSRHAREDLGFRRLLFRVAMGNKRARRAFESLGVRPIDRVLLYSRRLQADVEHIVYTLDLCPA
jgi:RimJ/RimL family protein N-acetyltransferase